MLNTPGLAVVSRLKHVREVAVKFSDSKKRPREPLRRDPIQHGHAGDHEERQDQIGLFDSHW
jgi:hypothetical protein